MQNWTPVVDQDLGVHAEPDNIHDPRAVVTYVDGNVIGHLPIEFSKTAWHFLHHGGTISCVVTGPRKYSDVSNKGLEVPCICAFKGKPAVIITLLNYATQQYDRAHAYLWSLLPL